MKRSEINKALKELEKENLLVLDVPAHVSLNDASAFLLSSGITMNQAFPADISKFL